MLSTNYKNLLKFILEKNKGFWRLEAISILTKKINKGEEKFKYLRNLITLQEKRITKHPFLQINSLNPKTPNAKKFKKFQSFRDKSSQAFFVTQIPKKKKTQLNSKLFLNKEEEKIYNHIELHPFEVNSVRRRDENQKYYNTQEIKKQFESSYNFIRNEQIKDRPFSSYYKRKMSKKFFGANFFSNNINMNKKRRSAYHTNYRANKTDNYSENVEIWSNLENKKRIISAYLKNREKRNLFGEDNILFEEIKKNSRNKSQYVNLLSKNKTNNNINNNINNINTTNTDNIIISMSTSEQNDATINNIKGKKNKKIFTPILLSK